MTWLITATLLSLSAIFAFSFAPSGIDVEGYTYGSINLQSPYFSSNLFSWAIIDFLRNLVGSSVFPNVFGFLTTALFSLTLYFCGQVIFGFSRFISFCLAIASVALPVCFLGAFNAYRQILAVIWFIAFTYFFFKPASTCIKLFNARRMGLAGMFLVGPLLHASFFVVWFSIGMSYFVTWLFPIISKLGIKKQWSFLLFAFFTISLSLSLPVVLGATLSTALRSYDRQSFSGLAYVYLIPLCIQMMVIFRKFNLKTLNFNMYIAFLCVGAMLLLQSPLNFQRLYFYPLSFLLFQICSFPNRRFNIFKTAVAFSPFYLFFSHQYQLILGLSKNVS